MKSDILETHQSIKLFWQAYYSETDSTTWKDLCRKVHVSLGKWNPLWPTENLRAVQRSSAVEKLLSPFHFNRTRLMGRVCTSTIVMGTHKACGNKSPTKPCNVKQKFSSLLYYVYREPARRGRQDRKRTMKQNTQKYMNIVYAYP